MEPRRVREVYRECMRNHAATLGLYATDGCCEFMADRTRPGGSHCAACGCHRSFHRKESFEVGGNNGGAAANGHGAAGGGGGGGGMNGVHGGGGDAPSSGSSLTVSDVQVSSRRARTRFSAQQKERMTEFAERIGWKLKENESDEAEVGSFCAEVGITRKSFEVWMQDKKNSS